LTGQSSIPETPLLEPTSRGVLDRPLSQAMTIGDVTPHSRGMMCPRFDLDIFDRLKVHNETLHDNVVVCLTVNFLNGWVFDHVEEYLDDDLVLIRQARAGGWTAFFVRLVVINRRPLFWFTWDFVRHRGD
jgi:hypothetical protein